MSKILQVTFSAINLAISSPSQLMTSLSVSLSPYWRSSRTASTSVDSNKLGSGCKIESFKATLSRGGSEGEFHMRLLRPTESGRGSEGQNVTRLLRPTETERAKLKLGHLGRNFVGN